MKKFLVLLLVFTQTAIAGAPPVSTQGQSGSAKYGKWAIQAPYNQFTDLGGIKSLIETGNTNLLANPNFEHTTATTGWTTTKTSGTTFSSAVETTEIAAGKQSLKITASSAYGTVDQSVTPSIRTASQNLEASCKVYATSATGVPNICALSGGSETNCVAAPVTSSWSEVSVPFVGPSNGTSVGVRFKTTVADTTSYYLDDCYVGPNRKLASGYMGSDWTSYTVTITGSSANPSVGTNTQGAYWRRVGDSMEIRYFLAQTGAGTAGTGTYLFNLPTGYTIDANKISADTAGRNNSVGAFLGYISASPAYMSNGSVFVYDSSHLALNGQVQNSTPSSQGPGIVGSTSLALSNTNISYAFDAIVPISGWTSSQAAYKADATPASWSGYHDNTCAFTRSSASYGDTAVDSTCGFVEVANRNFGTVTSYTSGGNKLPGIVFTPPRAGRYYVCAYPVINSTASFSQVSARLWDGTTTIAEGSRRAYTDSSSTDYLNLPLCGIYNASATSTTLSIQVAAAGANQVTVGSAGLGIARSTVEWSIFELDAPMPAPYLTGSVTSTTTGAEHIERAFISQSGGTYTVSSQSGNWISSLTKNGTGDITINVTSGEFSSAPSCSLGLQDAGYGFAIFPAATTTTTVHYGTKNGSGTNADFGGVYVQCMGPR